MRKTLKPRDVGAHVEPFDRTVRLVLLGEPLVDAALTRKAARALRDQLSEALGDEPTPTPTGGLAPGSPVTRPTVPGWYEVTTGSGYNFATRWGGQYWLDAGGTRSGLQTWPAVRFLAPLADPTPPTLPSQDGPVTVDLGDAS